MLRQFGDRTVTLHSDPAGHTKRRATASTRAR